MLRGPRVDGPLSESGDARQDLIGALRPDERLRVGLMGLDELLDGRFELGHTAERAATDLLHRELGKPAFDEAEPRAVRRGEVDVEARTFGEPVPNQRRFVGAVVVHDDVHVESTGDLRLNQVEEFAELRRAMALMKLRDHLAGLRVERGEQGRRAVALVVVRPAFDLAGLHRQQRLRAVERLDLRLLIDAEHRRMRRRIQIQADDIADFLDEQRIGRQLERLAPMRLQPERVPNAADGHVTQPDGLRHVARTPVRRPARRGFQRANHHLLDLLVGDRPLGAGPRLIVQPVQSLADEATAPFADRARRHMQASRHDLAVDALGARQDDARASRHVRRRSRAMGQRVQSLPFLRRQNQRNLGASRSHARLLVEQYRAGRAICFTFYG